MIQLDEVMLNNTILEEAESYQLDISPGDQVINITGLYPSGVFYGIQSLLSLYSMDTEIPAGLVVDYPRYVYRGMHVDVSRNFHRKEEIMRILDAMAMYKLNTLHIHLTDDEGWRIEIPGIPELTEVMSNIS